MMHLLIGHIYLQQKEFDRMSIFNVRRVTKNIHSVTQEIKQFRSIIIIPEKVVIGHYQENRVNITTLLIKNDSNRGIDFDLKQPQNKCLKVKCKIHHISSCQKVQLFLLFNSQGEQRQIVDSFKIRFNREHSIVVPIVVKKLKQLSDLEESKIKEVISPQNQYSKQKPITLYSDKNINDQSFSKELMIKRFQTHDSSTKSIAANRKHRRKQGQILKPNKVKFNNDKEMVQAFLSRYDKVKSYLKNKEIKNQIFLGERPINKSLFNDIMEFNALIAFYADERHRHLILSRHETLYSNEGPYANSRIQYQPKWKFNRNQPKITYHKAMRKFNEEIRKIVVNFRFQKIHKFMTVYRQFNNRQANIGLQQACIIENASQKAYHHQSLTNEDQINQIIFSNKEFSHKSIYELMKLQTYEEQVKEPFGNIFGDQQQTDEGKQRKKFEYFWHKINNMLDGKQELKLGYDFNNFSLNIQVLQQDFKSDQLNNGHRFDIKLRLGFDNWIPIDESSVSIHEMMGYQKKQQLNQWERFSAAHELFSRNRFEVEPFDETNCQEQFDYLHINYKEDQHNSCLHSAYKQSNKKIQQSYYKSYFQFELGPTEFDCHQNISKSVISSCIKTIKHEQMYFNPFFTQNLTQGSCLVAANLQQSHPVVIERGDRQDRVDWDQKRGKIDEIRNKNLDHSQKKQNKKRRGHNEGQRVRLRPKQNKSTRQRQKKHPDDSKQFTNQIREIMILHRKHSTQENRLYDSSRYEQEMENIDKIRNKELGELKSKVTCYNKYAKHGSSYIYL